VLEPIFEADFTDAMYGYRRQRSAQQAVTTVHQALQAGYTDVVEADLSRYFDTIPHPDLLKSVARRVSDGAMLHLLRLWLKAPVEERGEDGQCRSRGGRHHGMGTPQGGAISPLLANVYMHRFLRTWRDRGMDRHLRAKVVSYADDFVILCQGTAAEALAYTRRWMAALKLTLNETKTRVCRATVTPFDFLGYTFGPTVHRPTGRSYLAARPSPKALARVRDQVRAILGPGNQAPWPEVATAVNQVTDGWRHYFSYGTVARSYWNLDRFLLQRARRFLARRHKVPGQGTRRFPVEHVFGPAGLHRFRVVRGDQASHALA
jgi:RNA-directed DNA polymerase